MVGERCEVAPGDEGGLHKHGVVRFVGPTEFETSSVCGSEFNMMSPSVRMTELEFIDRLSFWFAESMGKATSPARPDSDTVHSFGRSVSVLGTTHQWTWKMS